MTKLISNNFVPGLIKGSNFTENVKHLVGLHIKLE